MMEILWAILVVVLILFRGLTNPMRRLLPLLALLVFLPGCKEIPCVPVQGLQACINQAEEGGPVVAQAGDWGDQTVTSGGVIVIARPGARFHSLNSRANDIGYSGFRIDAEGDQQLALHLSGRHTGFHNGSVGNVIDEKGAIVSGDDVTISHTRFHDVRIADPSTHNECLFATDANRLTVEDSRFERCATFDIFFTHCFNADCGDEGYGGVTLRRNFFGKTFKADNVTPHFYSVMAAYTGEGPAFCGGTTSPASAPLGYLKDWTVEDNTFELPTAYIFDCPARWQNFTASGNVGQRIGVHLGHAHARGARRHGAGGPERLCEGHRKQDTGRGIGSRGGGVQRTSAASTDPRNPVSAAVEITIPGEPVPKPENSQRRSGQLVHASSVHGLQGRGAVPPGWSPAVPSSPTHGSEWSAGSTCPARSPT